MVFIRKKNFIFKATVTKLERWPRIWKIYFLWKPYSATYQMNQNFIRINNILSKNRLNQPENFFMKNKAKNIEFFIYFKKRLWKDFLLDGSWFVCPWPMQKCKKPHSYIILVSNLVWDSSAEKSPSYLHHENSYWIILSCNVVSFFSLLIRNNQAFF